MIKFLISNWFSVTISLDGPKSIHDAKRIFKNGKGTFDRIWKNLQKINEIDINYFKTKVHFSSVYSKDLPITDRIDFFKHTPLIKDNIGVSSFVNFMHSNYYQKYTYDSEKFWNELNDVINSVKDKVIRKGKLNSSEVFFDKMTRLDTLGLRATSDMGGACILTRPLIDVNGKIHFCDKINSKFSFGDVWNGINLNKLKQIIKDFKKINQKHCSRCDFRFLCQRCYITFARDGVLEYDRKICESIKRTLMARLEKHVDFKEKEASMQNDSKGYSNNYRYEFHQFLKVVKGRTKSVIIDFLRENAFQVENKLIHEFENPNQDTCGEFINALKKENLVIKIKGNVWIPNQDEVLKSPLTKTFFKNERRFELEIEEGTDLDLIKKIVDNHSIIGISYFGSQKIDKAFPSIPIPISYKVKDIASCLSLCSVKPNFKKISESTYFFNLRQNSCWGRKIAITKDGMVRPCIHSNISIGKLSAYQNFQKLIEKVEKYWQITKDKVETCRDCEFRYICFDCREIAQRKNNGNLYAANPLCSYNPYTGKWHEHPN
jgi:radical SAM protein with 4Fe4S-binding SPASM domain